MLRFDGEGVGLRLRKSRLGPDPLEEVEPEVSPQCLLDHLAVATARAGGTELDRAEDVLVDR